MKIKLLITGAIGPMRRALPTESANWRRRWEAWVISAEHRAQGEGRKSDKATEGLRDEETSEKSQFTN